MSHKPLYTPQPDRLMRVVVLFSGGASALKFLLEHDANLGRKYAFVGAFTDRRDAPGIETACRAGIPVEVLDYREFIRAHRATYSDPKARRAYFETVARRLDRRQPDVLMLAGFMLIVTDPLLSTYTDRILNVHPADLTVVDDRGARKYTGMDAVAQAIEAGETQTRSTVHLVTRDVDAGPIVALSEPLAVEQGITPERHQEKMKWACDGPAYLKALSRIAEGRVWIDPVADELEIR